MASSRQVHLDGRRLCEYKDYVRLCVSPSAVRDARVRHRTFGSVGKMEFWGRKGNRDDIGQFEMDVFMRPFHCLRNFVTGGLGTPGGKRSTGGD